jgi:HAD superfamily hydrolase (TIGR01484 family)
MKSKHVFITDLDGTLFRSDRSFSPEDLTMLEKLGKLGVTRILATGRSLFALDRAITEPPFPVDFLIFSTGLGVARYPDPRNNMLKTESLTADDTARIVSFLEDLSVDYMIQAPLPDNHKFSYRYRDNENPDFFTRISAYKYHCTPVAGKPENYGPCSQLLAVIPGPDAMSTCQYIRERLPRFNVIKTTSPFDGRTLWVEIFPKTVSKGQAAAWLAKHLEIDKLNCVAVGNDYNDEDLLEWAGKAYIVENGPFNLKRKYTVVGSNDNNGVSEAISTAFGI